MPSKITLGLTLSATGLLVSLAAPIIHLTLTTGGVESLLGTEPAPGFPLHLLLSIAGVPIALLGLLLFRRGVREELAAERLGTDLGVDGAGAQSGGQEGVGAGGGSVMPLGEEALERLRRGVRVRSASLSQICAGCGAETPVGEANCSRCGLPFGRSSDPVRACPVCGADLSGSHRLDGGSYVCPTCFSELEIDQEAAKRIFT